MMHLHSLNAWSTRWKEPILLFIVHIYTPKNDFCIIKFSDEWSAYLDYIATVTEKIFVTGDLNFQLDDPTILDAHGLIQHVTGATHTGGHTLDMAITRDVRCIIHGMPSIVDLRLWHRSWDHLGIYKTLDYTKPQHIKWDLFRETLCYFSARIHEGHRNINHSPMYNIYIYIYIYIYITKLYFI